VAGAVKDVGHGQEEQDEFDPASVPFRRWEEYERAWRKSQWRKQQKMASMAAAQYYGLPVEASPVAYYPMDPATSEQPESKPYAHHRMSMMSAGSVESGSILQYGSAVDQASDVSVEDKE
jgi:hypothetical protein